MSNTLVRLNLLPFLLFNYSRSLVRSKILRDILFYLYLLITWRLFWIFTIVINIVEPNNTGYNISLLVMYLCKINNYIFKLEEEYEGKEEPMPLSPRFRFISLNLITIGTFIYTLIK